MSSIPTPPPAFRIQLQPSGRSFACAPGQTVLDAALAAGIVLPHQCKTGSCLSCQAQVLNGQTDCKQPDTDAALPGTQALLCCTRPLSDLSLQCRELDGQWPVARANVRVLAMDRLAADVMRLQLGLPPGQHLGFGPGQYLDIHLGRGLKRSYSLAAAPRDDGTMELHVRLRPGGVFTGQILEKLKPRDVLRIEGPFGMAAVATDGGAAPAPLLLLATGTGMAPVKALLESAMAQAQPRSMVLYCGGRSLDDLYLHAQCLQWQQEHAWFRYIPVLSRAPLAWEGRRGHVQEMAVQDWPQLQGCEVFACGSPEMVTAARTRLLRQGLPAMAFHADAFTSATV